MSRLKIERVGGLAGFGLPGSRLRSRCDIALDNLSQPERTAIDALFSARAMPQTVSAPDGFRYRITLRTAEKERTIEVDENQVPATLRSRMTDELE